MRRDAPDNADNQSNEGDRFVAGCMLSAARTINKNIILDIKQDELRSPR